MATIDLQLFAYSLSAIKEFQCQPEKIDLYKVFNGRKVAKYTMSEKAVMRTRARIIQDVDQCGFWTRMGAMG